jgi:hypothetical protein
MTLWDSFWSNFSSSDIFWMAIWWLALCGVVAWLAHAKGQNRTAFFAIAFFFSPVVGLLAVMAARDLHSATQAQQARDEFHELLGPLLLQVDGIRGHLAVSREQPRVTPPKAQPAPPPATSAAPPKKAAAAPSAETTAPRAQPALANGALPS